MKIYRIKGDRDMVLEAGTETADASLVKVKLDTILVSHKDIALYEGKVNVNYPVVPCHMATAVVSEDRPEYDLKRGTKVIINPYILSSIDGEDLTGAKMYGLDADGFLRDFTALPIDNIIPYPEEVKGYEAIFTEQLAVALAAMNAFEINKGEYIAVIGGSVLSNIIAQLALYYQYIPIYISNDERHLEIAKNSGIDYVINEMQDDAYQRVFNITGGRMADHTILHAKMGVSPHFLFSLAKTGGDCLIVSLTKTMPKMTTDVELISKKQLTVRGVSCGAEEFNSAVNMLAQKQIDFSGFIDETVDFKDAEKLFHEMSQNPLQYVNPVIKL